MSACVSLILIDSRHQTPEKHTQYSVDQPETSHGEYYACSHPIQCITALFLPLRVHGVELLYVFGQFRPVLGWSRRALLTYFGLQGFGALI
jgi:hypothetical protein